MALIGKIIAMTGVATVQNEKGDKRALHPGDQIQTGDSIQTTAGVDVDVQLANGRVIHIGSDQMVAFTPELAEVFAPTEADSAVNVATIDTVIQAIQDGRDINQVLEETAAGGAGGSDGSHSALYLERINQTLNTFGFEDAAASSDQLLLANGLTNIVPFVGDITPDTDAEGTVLTHTVTLTNVLGTPQTFAFSIVGNTATAGVDFTSGFTFSNNVTFTPSANNPFVGTITVPAGVTGFTVSIQTNSDTVVEGNETYTINVGDVSAIGTIADKPTVSIQVGGPSAEDDTVPEGTALVYNVTLNGTSTVPVTYPFTLGGGTGTASANDIGAPTFSNGVTLSNGVITVPAGVTSFSVTVPTLPNDVYEGTETVPLTIGTVEAGGATAVGSINDEADKTTVSIQVGGPSAEDDTVPEGTALVYNVTLNGTSTVPVTYPFTLGGGTGTASANDIGAPTFSNGVTLSNGVITVPAGVTSFSVTVPTLPNDVYEGTETVPLTIGGATAIGFINDEADKPTVSIQVGGPSAEDDTVPEGTALVYNVTLNGTSTVPVTYPFTLGGGTGTASANDIGAPTFNNGVTLSNGVITVPAGVTSFSVTVPTLPNDVYEGTETVPLTIGGATAIGFINDEADKPTVSIQVGGPSAEDDTVPEGTALVYNVTLNGTSTVPVTYPFTLGGGTGTASANDIGAPTFSNGVTLSNGVITVPAGVTSFSVTVPTLPNDVYEGTETVPLTIGGATAVGSIYDEVFVTKVTAGVPDPIGNNTVGAVVLEGDPLRFSVELNAAATRQTTVNIVLTSGTAIVGTDTGPTGQLNLLVSFNGGSTYVAVNGTLATGLSVDVPVGVRSFIISVPTIVDGVYEQSENILLSAGTVANPATLPLPFALGTITDIQGSISATGLSGQYYGYNDTNVAGNRVYANDPNVGNLDGVQDIVTIVNSRNRNAGGPENIVGKNDGAVDGAADVRFNATTISYNPDDIFSNNLGNNQDVAGRANSPIGNGNLRTFLGNDATSAKVDAGLGNSTDAIVRLTGKIYLERGNYDFKVLADDGFSLRINNKTLIEYDGNQAPTSREYTNLYLDDSGSGLTGIELLYWEQGARGVLQIQYKLSSETEYKTLSLSNLAMFSNEDMGKLPNLTDTQDIVKNANGSYSIRNGKTVLGTDNADNALDGSSAKDVIRGLGGDDTLRGLDGADSLYGGAGRDRLEGGAGNDKLDGGTGNDTMIGGTGDDIYIVDNAGDIVFEDLNAGTDTIEFSENYNFSNNRYNVASGIENVEIKGAQNVTVIGNVADNRIVGGSGNNTLSGGDGDDRLIGGRGNDRLTGGDGNDVFEWKLGDNVGTGVPQDVITDFKYTGNGTGNAQSIKTDSIDLRDLLQGENSSQVDFSGPADPGNLLNYLHFTVNGNSTVIDVSSRGGFATGGNGVVDQKIVLQNVNLFTETGTGLNDQTLLLQKILANGTLIVD